MYNASMSQMTLQWILNTASDYFGVRIRSKPIVSIWDNEKQGFTEIDASKELIKALDDEADRVYKEMESSASTSDTENSEEDEIP